MPLPLRICEGDGARLCRIAQSLEWPPIQAEGHDGLPAILALAFAVVMRLAYGLKIGDVPELSFVTLVRFAMVNHRRWLYSLG